MSVDPALVAGTQCPSRLKALPLKGGAFAACGDAMVARRRHALMPMGPGDKRRDDSCAYGAIEEPPPTLCDPFSVTSRSGNGHGAAFSRSEEHTSELQSLMRISYAVFCLQKKKYTQNQHNK